MAARLERLTASSSTWNRFLRKSVRSSLDPTSPWKAWRTSWRNSSSCGSRLYLFILFIVFWYRTYRTNEEDVVTGNLNRKCSDTNSNDLFVIFVLSSLGISLSDHYPVQVDAQKVMNNFYVMSYVILSSFITPQTARDGNKH